MEKYPIIPMVIPGEFCHALGPRRGRVLYDGFVEL
jgi:hypothetical protein